MASGGASREGEDVWEDRERKTCADVEFDQRDETYTYRQARDDQDLKSSAEEVQPKDQDAGKTSRSWIMSGLSLGAAFKVGAVLGVTTLGAATLGVVAAGAYGAYQAIKTADWSDEDVGPVTRSESQSSTSGEEKRKETDESSSHGDPTRSDGLEKSSETLIDVLNQFYKSCIASSSAKRMAVQDLVENVRRRLSHSLIKMDGNLVKGELVQAAFDKFITKQQDERILMLPLAFNRDLWEFVEAGSDRQDPGASIFWIKRVNLGSFGIGASPWDDFLCGPCLSIELLHKFWKKKLDQMLNEEKLLDCDHSIELKESGIELFVENPTKGYADMLCIKIILFVRSEKGGEPIFISSQPVTSLQDPAFPSEFLWVQSSEEMAVQEMETLDQDGGCRCKCLILLDAILSTQPSFKTFSLYILATILLKLCEEETEWDEEMLVERFLDLLKALEDHLKTGIVQDRFHGKVNLLAPYCSSKDISTSVSWLAYMLETECRIKDWVHSMTLKATKK